MRKQQVYVPKVKGQIKFMSKERKKKKKTTTKKEEQSNSEDVIYIG